MKFKTFLEKSYDTEDIPKNFYITTVFEKAVSGLLSGKLAGIRGISASENIKDIIAETMDADFDILIKMDAKKVLASNKLSRVMYTNPWYLAQDNMKAYKRIASFTTNDACIESLIRSYISNGGSNYKTVIKHHADFVPLRYLMDNKLFKSIFKTALKQIKDLPDLAKKMKIGIYNSLKKGESIKKPSGDTQDRTRELKKLDTYSKELFIKLFEEALKFDANYYYKETEWKIKTGPFTVPPKSTLIITLSKKRKLPLFSYLNYNSFAEIQPDTGKSKNLYEKNLDKLGKKYTLKFKEGSFDDI